jgi:hypothetical protein
MADNCPASCSHKKEIKVEKSAGGTKKELWPMAICQYNFSCAYQSDPIKLMGE